MDSLKVHWVRTGKTIGALSKETGMSEATISRVLNDRNPNLHVKNAVRLAQALEISMDTFVEATGYTIGYQPERLPAAA